MENENGYWVYKDKKGVEIFDHPKLLAILSHLRVEFSDYKYTVYRCASKIVVLQEVLYTYYVPYKLVLSILEKHNLNQSEGATPIYPCQLTSIIHDVLFASDKLGHLSQFSSFDLKTATEVLANFIWNVFDLNRTSPILLLELKETFLILCEIKSLDQMISEFFNLVADYNRCVSRFRLETLLRILSKILSFIGEDDSYGAQNITDIIEQCFAKCPGINGINEYQFNCLWTTTNTRFLIYGNLLALVKRIKATRRFVHDNQCASCLVEKIVGIRFKCQVCRNVSLCMKCFSIGFESRKHVSVHRMYEVFSEDTRRNKWTHYLAKLCNIFFSERESDARISDAKGACDERNIDLLTSGDSKSVEVAKDDTHIKKDSIELSNLNSSQTTFHAIIERLSAEKEKIEKQKRIYENYKNEDKKSICDFLDSHRETLSNIIDQLYCLMKNSTVTAYPTSSTPNRLGSINGHQELGSMLLRSINGAEINKSYLEANKTDYSLSDLSTWFYQRKETIQKSKSLSVVQECDDRDTKMDNFRALLLQVKEIVEDSYSDNFQLAEATSHLEAFLDCVIKEEEIKRQKIK